MNEIVLHLNTGAAMALFGLALAGVLAALSALMAVGADLAEVLWRRDRARRGGRNFSGILEGPVK